MGRALLLVFGTLVATAPAWGGPPFETDDPEPVEFHHWEVYLASQYSHGPDGAAGTCPQLEVNYGIAPELQLHLIAPCAFDAASGSNPQFGFGDTELGAKYRFVTETDSRPQIGVFPLAELPTGDRARGLGSGHTQFFLPVWLQKRFGAWTTYGGVGYWINPGAGNRNWLLAGWLIQKQVRSDLAVGVEIVHETSQSEGGEADTKMNIGLTWDLDQMHHVLASVGPTLQGPKGYQAYLAFQFTFGPGR